MNCKRVRELLCVVMKYICKMFGRKGFIGCSSDERMCVHLCLCLCVCVCVCVLCVCVFLCVCMCMHLCVHACVCMRGKAIPPHAHSGIAVHTVKPV